MRQNISHSSIPLQFHTKQRRAFQASLAEIHSIVERLVENESFQTHFWDVSTILQVIVALNISTRLLFIASKCQTERKQRPLT